MRASRSRPLLWSERKPAKKEAEGRVDEKGKEEGGWKVSWVRKCAESRTGARQRATKRTEHRIEKEHPSLGDIFWHLCVKEFRLGRFFVLCA